MRRWAPPLIGGPRAARASDGAGEVLSYADEQVRRAVRAASRRSPLPFSCLDEAVAGGLMLRRRGFHAAVVVGLPTTDAVADSHAWLLGSCDAIVLGHGSAPNYAPVTVFRKAPR